LGQGYSAGERGESLVWHVLLIAAAGSVLFLLLLALVVEQFLSFLDGCGETLSVAMNYCRILFPFAGILWLTSVLSAVLRGMGNLRFPALLMILAALLQIPLSGALILGWGVLPALGVAGAAIAIISVSCFNVLVLLGRLAFGEVTVKLRLDRVALSMALVRDIFNVALPASLSPALTVLGIMSMTGRVGRFGLEALAGCGIGSRFVFARAAGFRRGCSDDLHCRRQYWGGAMAAGRACWLDWRLDSWVCGGCHRSGPRVLRRIMGWLVG
jgi:Na+-driven multidrug efflux pump